MTEECDQTPVVMYTDGACLGNPGPGGYGVLLLAGDRRKELSAGYRLTTNNRMEILAVIEGLRALRQPSDVTVVSDSMYVVESITKGWVKGWRAKGWKKSDGAPALNADLWEQLWQLTQQHHVTFEWVRGHAGEVGNERVDRLSVAAAKGKHLLEDTGYLTGGKAPGVSPTPNVASQQALFGSGGTSGDASASNNETLSGTDHMQPRASSPLPRSGGGARGGGTRPPLPTRSPGEAPGVSFHEAASAFDGTPDNRATEVRAGAGFLTITFRDERELRVPLAWYPALAAASPAERADYTIADDGRTVRFPRLGVEVSVARVLGLDASP